MFHPSYWNQEGSRGFPVAPTNDALLRGWKNALSHGSVAREVDSEAGSEYFFDNTHGVNWLNARPASSGRRRSQIRYGNNFPELLADAELPNDRLIALGIVSLEVVEQATPLADQHEQAAARAVVLLVRLEVVRQLANAFTDDGDLNLGTPRVSRVRLILVNYGFLLLSG
jgi:hypothetical protein